ncbi:fumarylacetoacetate hydrolase [Akanthomyces lecanii RCEF 1005]|uniref:Fumarylacetoacetate hydrolase n=1 Tax=Akanthomyces lecanii RCEF 1005 TaxID=1081108 RepID=A0A168ITY7_CORDF|nr:fumarylacetoacetate hydrolase [Akanthomyces lecanii RCEF 1005]
MGLSNGKTASKINYVAFELPGGVSPRIGHLDLDRKEIAVLSYKSGTPLSSLYEVIEMGQDGIAKTGEVLPLSSVKLLAPVSGRDVLAVGKNYTEHAKEFNASGYDASDKADIPTHPVIFTKRATSIIAHGDDIFPHPGFTESVDYEGEIGVIIGKAGFRISEADAMNHVWGYTIINDMTARERQRDHKQFYIGKSPDTFCPMGPVAVAKEDLPSVLEIETTVNGEKRQTANTDQLIFSIPYLIQTMSAGQTLRPGDVLATGTPAGVGFGFRPMKFLHQGDEISVSVTGLGTLTNRIASPNSVNSTLESVSSESHIPQSNVRAPPSILTSIGAKHLFYQKLEAKRDSGENIAFIHGLGSSSSYFAALTAPLQEHANLHLMDLEGHGQSPTSASSTLSIASFAKDVANVLDAADAEEVTVVAHSLGCLVAVKLALDRPNLVKKLVLMGPPPSPLPEAGVTGTIARVKAVRDKGMFDVSNTILQTALSDETKLSNPTAVAAVRISLLGQDPEGYAKACGALASAPGMDFAQIKAPTFIITGSEDKVSPPALCDGYSSQISRSKVETLDKVGHWHLFEASERVVSLVAKFVKE